MLSWTCAGILVAIAGAIFWQANRRPAVNQAQAQAMLPVINSYLGSNRQLAQFGGALDATLKPKVFCEASIIEIRPDGPRWRVGLQINCGEFARSQDKLLEGSQGYPGIADVAILTHTGRHYQVANLHVGPPYWDKPWVDQNFSSRAARWILSASPPTAPSPISQARRAFGFPAGTHAAGQV